jgi:hypothetical protein
MTSTHSSYRQAPGTSVSLSYRQASALPGFRLPPPTRSYSPEQDDEVSTSMNAMPLTINRSRNNTPLGSHKSLSESIQSLRSNQQPSISLPVKKRLHDLPIKSSQIRKENHYHNPIELQTKTDNTSSEEEEIEHQQIPVNSKVCILKEILVLIIFYPFRRRIHQDIIKLIFLNKMDVE